MELATFAAGCFWCMQEFFYTLKGVYDPVVGYSGGNTTDPIFEIVYRGDSDHYEAVRFNYDPDIISYEALLSIFFDLHDPTYVADIELGGSGKQYDSVIFYHTEEQRMAAEQRIEYMKASQMYSDPITTKIIEASEFYPEHQKAQMYYRKGYKGECSEEVIKKLTFLHRKYRHLVDDNKRNDEKSSCGQFDTKPNEIEIFWRHPPLLGC